MIKGKSKFDFDIFYGDWSNWMGFSKQKYTEQEAIAKWREEVAIESDETDYVIEDAFVRYRYGRNEDNETLSGWWLEWEDYGNKYVPAWSIHSEY